MMFCGFIKFYDFQFSDFGARSCAPAILFSIGGEGPQCRV
jgi:hypothetical protein